MATCLLSTEVGDFTRCVDRLPAEAGEEPAVIGHVGTNNKGSVEKRS